MFYSKAPQEFEILGAMPKGERERQRETNVTSSSLLLLLHVIWLVWK